ncbi:hypothetical protein DL93DRAFT_999627 [Clavulina sp. PMI_390]|nr:hypothetical protein DL93DRAFT_999627 [Clavulina sp. PMI_390]
MKPRTMSSRSMERTNSLPYRIPQTDVVLANTLMVSLATKFRIEPRKRGLQAPDSTNNHHDPWATNAENLERDMVSMRHFGQQQRHPRFLVPLLRHVHFVDSRLPQYADACWPTGSPQRPWQDPHNLQSFSVDTIRLLAVKSIPFPPHLACAFLVLTVAVITMKEK